MRERRHPRQIKRKINASYADMPTSVRALRLLIGNRLWRRFASVPVILRGAIAIAMIRIIRSHAYRTCSRLRPPSVREQNAGASMRLCLLLAVISPAPSTSRVPPAMLASSGASAKPNTGGASIMTTSKFSLALDSSLAIFWPANSSAGLGGSGPVAMKHKARNIRFLQKIWRDGAAYEVIR